jgi:tetratricopeptide (TPR) repeat protein
LSKSVEIKKRARRLAQAGRFAEAITALQELVRGDRVDPYDLVALGDLCTREGHIADAIDYYHQAVQSYATSSLYRNGIALCRKVLRIHPDEGRFHLRLAELCERESQTLDAVSGYLDYASSLSSIEDGEGTAWLDSLGRLVHRNVSLLRRQAELLARAGRGEAADSLLQLALEQIDDEGRDALEELIASMGAGPAAAPVGRKRREDVEAVRKIVFDAPADDALPEIDLSPGREEKAAAPPAPESEFDQDFLSDLSLDLEDAPAQSTPATPADTPAVTKDRTPTRSDLRVIEPAPTPKSPTRDADRADGRTLSPRGTPVRDLDLGLADETAEATPQAPARSLLGPTEAADLLVDSPADGGAALDDPAAAVEESDPADATRRLEEELRQRPGDRATLEKLIEIHERQGDILPVLDLREQLASALMQDGEAEEALDQYRRILEADPSHHAARRAYAKLASEIGVDGQANAVPREAPAGVDAATVASAHLRDSAIGARVEIRDDAPAIGADDAMDLGALISEFQAGLRQGLAEKASPQAYYDMGVSHLEMGLFKEAAEAFAGAANDPRIGLLAREMWGRCLRELGQNHEAERILRAALAERPESLGVRYQLARTLESMQETTEALRLLVSILREDPDFEDVRQRAEAIGGPDCIPRRQRSS